MAQLPKDYAVEVLLAETGTKDYQMEEYYLVKTEFGLVGWFKEDDGYEGAIIGLRYAGD